MTLRLLVSLSPLVILAACKAPQPVTPGVAQVSSALTSSEVAAKPKVVWYFATSPQPSSPSGRYVNKIYKAVAKRWYTLSVDNQESLAPAKVRVRFNVTQEGRTKDVAIVKKTGDIGSSNVALALKAVREAQIPPMPADLLADLRQNPFPPVEYDFVVH